jgi:membrane dipeptidase
MEPVLDGHNDVLLRLEEAARAGRPRSFADGDDALEVDAPKARAGGFAGGFFACYAPAELGVRSLGEIERTDDGTGWSFPYSAPLDPAQARPVTFALAARLLELERAGSVRVARTMADLEAAVAGDGPPAAILHVEGAEAIDADTLAELDVLHAAGLRSIGPVWSRPNAFAHGVPFRFPGSPDVGPGLTEAGRRLVGRCNALGILVDLAHLNERGFWDVAALTSAPLVATHTAAHALCPTARNLTDAQIDAIGESDGLVGVVLNTADLGGEWSGGGGVGVADVVAHCRHVAERIGIEHVALGSDWDGARPPVGLEHCGTLPVLLGALRDAGWGDDDVRAFAHGNWLRVLAATWAP